MKKFNTAMLIAVFTLGTVASSWALFGLGKSLEGTVQTIGENMITITKEDDPAKQVSFEINNETEFDQIASLKELAEGDHVKIDYKEEGDKKIATSVSKEDASGEAEQYQSQTPQR